MSRDRSEGFCQLCGAWGELSYEHVPPKAAYNNQKAVKAQFEEWLTSDGNWSGKGKIDQRGSGAFTLCEPCNNLTGTWYGAEYVAWSRSVAPFVPRIPMGDGVHELAFRGGHPLRFMKQAITMMFSANSSRSAPGASRSEFADRNPALVTFVRDQYAQALPSHYELYLTLVDGQHSRSVGVAGKLSLSTGRTEILTEVAFPPFGLVLSLDGPLEESAGRITDFARFGYDEEADVTVRAKRGQIYSPYPGDYRSKEQIRLEAAGR